MSQREEARARATRTLSEFRTSGLTQRAFCERSGIKLPTLNYWLARERSEKHPPSPQTETQDSFVPVLERTPEPSTEAAHLTLHLPSGLQVTVACGYPVEDLRRVASALLAVDAC